MDIIVDKLIQGYAELAQLILIQYVAQHSTWLCRPCTVDEISKSYLYTRTSDLSIIYRYKYNSIISSTYTNAIFVDLNYLSIELFNGARHERK